MRLPTWTGGWAAWAARGSSTCATCCAGASCWRAMFLLRQPPPTGASATHAECSLCASILTEMLSVCCGLGGVGALIVLH